MKLMKALENWASVRTEFDKSASSSSVHHKGGNSSQFSSEGRYGSLPDHAGSIARCGARLVAVRIGCVLAALFVSTVAFGEVLHESAKLLASDGGKYDRFGFSVSVSGDVIVVGTYSGAAYVFRRNPDNPESWVEEQKLLSPDGPGTRFGSAVSVSGDVLVVGADAQYAYWGAAYVYRWNKNGTNSWTLEQKLMPSDQGIGSFGWSVSVCGGVIIVGAPLAWMKDENNRGLNSGAAYIFRWNGSSWLEEQRLLPPIFPITTTSSVYFGRSVSVSGDLVLVGASGDGINGSRTGSAYVYRSTGSSWEQEDKLIPSDGASFDAFGTSVSIHDELAIVGARGHNHFVGAAYIFHREGTLWIEKRKLPAEHDDLFGGVGNSVSVCGNIAIAAGFEVVGRGDPPQGAAYVFRRAADEPAPWILAHKLFPDGLHNVGKLGYSVSISGDIVVAGASAAGDNGHYSGAVYVFTLPCADSDGDKVCDADDACPDSHSGETIVMGECYTSVINVLFDNGCTMTDLVYDCAKGAINHGQFVRCVAQLTHDWSAAGLIRREQKGLIRRCAARAAFPQGQPDDTGKKTP